MSEKCRGQALACNDQALVGSVCEPCQRAVRRIPLTLHVPYRKKIRHPLLHVISADATSRASVFCFQHTTFFCGQTVTKIPWLGYSLGIAAYRTGMTHGRSRWESEPKKSMTQWTLHCPETLAIVDCLFVNVHPQNHVFFFWLHGAVWATSAPYQTCPLVTCRKRCICKGMLVVIQSRTVTGSIISCPILQLERKPANVGASVYYLSSFR